MEQKLILSTKKTNDGTSIISARIHNSLIDRIDVLARRTNRKRNEMVQILLNYAVDNTVVEDDE